MRSVFLIELTEDRRSQPPRVRRFFSLFDASKPFVQNHWINLQPFVLRVALPLAIREVAQLDVHASSRMLESLVVEEDASSALAAQWQFVRMELPSKTLLDLDATSLTKRLHTELEAYFFEAPEHTSPQYSPSGQAWGGVCPEPDDFEWIFSALESLTLSSEAPSGSSPLTQRRTSRL